MKSVRILLLCCICLGVYVLLDASPAHAAVESAGLFDRVTDHFKNSLTKWGDTMTTAATALFWMLATVAFCWEFGNLALRGGSMEAALAYVLRFVLIEGIWLYILQNAVPIGTAIIESLRHLGSIASGLPRDLMPSAVLDVGFGVLWKAIVFVGKNTLSAPIVSFCALIMALLILLSCAVTAINMVVLIVSQWFLLYGGVFFLGFGGAPWTSDKARNYLLLALSIGAQLFGMAAVVGLGQSFMQDQYAQMSGDTALGELAVILIVALLICLLSNDIPKLFTRFAPGYTPQGLGIATMLGATATAAAAVAASAAMAKGAMETTAGLVKAANAAHSAAKAQSSRSVSAARSQTGVSSSRLGSNSSSAAGSGERASTQTQGPLGAMFAGNGIGFGKSRSGPGELSAATSRSSTQASPTEQHGSAASKSSSKPSSPSNADDQQASAGTKGQPTPSAGADSDAPSQTPRASTQTDAQAQNGRGASDHGQETSEVHSGGSGGAKHEEEAPTGSGAESNPEYGHDDDHEEAEASPAHNDTRSADSEASDDEASATDESDRAQNAGTGSDPSRSQSDDDEGAIAATETGTARSEPAGGHTDSSAAAAASGDSPTGPSSAPPNHGSGVATAAPTAAASIGAADTATASPTAQTQPSSAALAPSTPTSSSTSGAHAGATRNKGAKASGATGSGASDSTPSTSSAAPASKAASDVEGAAAQAASSPASGSGSAAVEPTETPGTSGGTRGSTSIGTIAATAKILGQQTMQYQAGRVRDAIAGFSARADQTVGGRIAQAIRKTYNLDSTDTENSSRPLRSHTGASKFARLESNTSGPREPADWATGDDPMTENQHFFLSSRLGTELDPNMTKAEASMLIEEIIDDER